MLPRDGAIWSTRTLRSASQPEGGPRPPGTTLVSLATAHPAKFPEAVAAAPGIEPELPAELAGIIDRTERLVTIPAGLEAARSFIWEAVEETG